MSQKIWLIVIFVVGSRGVLARPQDGPHPVYRPDSEATATNGGLKKTNIEDLAVVARASSDSAVLAPAVVAVADQLFDTKAAEMVDTDMRTPPKLKEIIKEKKGESEVIVDKIEANGKFEVESDRPSLATDSSEGKASHSKKKEEEGIKGVAVPVIMDTEEVTQPSKKLQKMPDVQKPAKEEKKKATGKPHKENVTTTPSSGLSTWILLSDNREATTPSGKKPTKGDDKDKKRVTTTKKPNKAQLVTASPQAKPATPKPSASNKTEPLTALEAMVKNQKKAQTTSTTTVKPKVELTTKVSVKKTENKKKPDKVYERIDLAEKVEERKPSTLPPMIKLTTDNPTSLEVTDSTGAQITTTETIETTTKKKKKSSSKRKKNKNRRKKPSKTGGELEMKETSVKNPKQPVGAQLYNFLSREIMPTVGLGLVGVLVTAGLAGLLGYNPFVGGSLPVRRTYETQHGYSPNKHYYSPQEYPEHDGGQSEEVLFREVLSGMPEDSRYGLTNAEPSYQESQLYKSQEQAYDSLKKPVDASYPYSDTYGYGGGEETKDKYPVYNAEASYVYPDPDPEKDDVVTGAEAAAVDTTTKHSAKYSHSDTMERSPEALYRVAPESDSHYDGTIQGTNDQSWHRIGSPMDVRPHLEPGPRSLDIKKRQKRETEQNDNENEIDFEETASMKDGLISIRTASEIPETTTMDVTTSSYNEATTEGSESTTEVAITEAPADKQVSTSTTTTTEAPIQEQTEAPPSSFVQILRRIAKFKLLAGLSFLKRTTDAFSKYLDETQKKVDESISKEPSISILNPFRTNGLFARRKRSLKVKEMAAEKPRKWQTSDKRLRKNRKYLKKTMKH